MDKTIYTPIYRKLIGTLRDARRERGMRQQDVAQVLGVSRNWISKVERCEVRLDVLNYVRLCLALDLDAGETLGPVIETVMT
jgi:transcriptional regulator with XRE-family HTH domain